MPDARCTRGLMRNLAPFVIGTTSVHRIPSHIRDDHGIVKDDGPDASLAGVVAKALDMRGGR